MRAFLVAIVTAAVIAIVASFALEKFQVGSDVANTTSGTRLDKQKKNAER